MSHPTKRPLLHGQAPAATAPSTSASTEAALPILEARFGVIAQALTGSTIATSAYSTIIPALQSFLSPALTVTRGQVFGPTSTTATLPTTSPHPLQGLLIIDRSYPSISASPSSPAASDHWFPIESVAGYIELSDAYDEYELVRLRASIDQLHKLSLQSETRRSTTPIPVFHLCLSSGTASLASASSTSLDLHVVAHSVALRFAHDTGMKGVFILNEGMVVRHDCLFPSGTPMGNQPSTAPFVVARIKTHGHGPVLGMALLLAHALAGVNNETSRNAHLIKQYAKASVWQATAPEPRSHQPTARSSVIAATAAAAQSVIQHVNKQQQSQPKKQESTPAQSQTQQPTQSQVQPQPQPQPQPQTQTQQPQQKKGRGKKQGQTQGQVQGDKLSQTQPVKSRPQSATQQKKNEQQEKKEEKKVETQEKKEETKTASPQPQKQQQQQQQKQRPKSARTSMSATMNVEKKPRPSTAGPTTEKPTTSADVDDDDDDTDVRTDVDLTVVGTHVSGIVGDVKPNTTTTENKKKGKGKKGGKPQQQQQQQQDETKQTSKPAVPVQNKSTTNHTTPGGPSTTNTNTATTNGTANNKSSPNKKHNRRRSNQQQRKNSNASYKPVTPATNVPLSLPSPPKSTAQVLAEKLLTSPPTTEKKESKTPYDDDFNPFA